MAATRGTVRGQNKNSDTGEASRLGHEAIETQAATFRTFVDVQVWKGGTAHLTIKRDGVTLLDVSLREPEDGSIPASELVCYSETISGGHGDAVEIRQRDPMPTPCKSGCAIPEHEHYPEPGDGCTVTT